jgi:SET domain-containing protein
MALLEKQLVVKKSTLPGAGSGLFTKKFIPKDTRIVEYKGRITTWKEADHDGGFNFYLFCVKRNHTIDARPYKKALGRFANDVNGPGKIAGVRNNSVFVIDGLQVFIESTRDIPAGAEVFVDYGKDYWKVLKKIFREKEMEEKQAAKAEKAAKATKKTPAKRGRPPGTKKTTKTGKTTKSGKTAKRAKA